MEQWFWLLILAAIALLVFYRLNRHSQQTSSRDRLSQLYFTGLNYLLNEQPDKAIDTFIQVMKADPDTVELHLALGNLFRRKGNIERATRLHQSLIIRTDLLRRQRADALYELSQDYYKAGLLDRAENLLLEYLALEPKNPKALWMLVHLYEQEKEWEKAADISKRLQSQGEDKATTNIAQYYCEMAQEKLALHANETAISWLKKAIGTDKYCARAYALMADASFQGGDERQAQKRWAHINKIDPCYYDEILPDIAVKTQATAGDAAGQKLIHSQMNETSGINGMFLVADWLKRQGRQAEAANVVTSWLDRHSSSEALMRMLESGDIQLAGFTDANFNPALAKILKDFTKYQCRGCGYECNTMYWQCPGCNEWNTVRRRTCQ